MRLTVRKGFISQHTKNTLIIFDTEKSLLYTFNSTAKFIFQKLQKGIQLDQIPLLITKEFKITEKKARKDTEEFIKILEKKGIVDK